MPVAFPPGFDVIGNKQIDGCLDLLTHIKWGLQICQLETYTQRWF